MGKRINLNEGLSVMEAAAELGTTRLRILMLIKEGALEGIMEGDEWLVTRSSLDCFRIHGGEVKAKTTCRHTCGGGSCVGHD
jgi:excisionase family DNA binding protein